MTADALTLAQDAVRITGYVLTARNPHDLVAVPWTAKADAVATVVEAVRAAVGGWIVVADPKGRTGYCHLPDLAKRSPVTHPHGRQGWMIFGGTTGHRLDLSIMPLVHLMTRVLTARPGEPIGYFVESSSRRELFRPDDPTQLYATREAAEREAVRWVKYASAIGGRSNVVPVYR